jgi:hypothetical protein
MPRTLHTLLSLSVLPHPRGHALSAVVRNNPDMLDITIEGVPPKSAHVDPLFRVHCTDYMIWILPAPVPIGHPAAVGWCEGELYGAEVLRGAH